MKVLLAGNHNPHFFNSVECRERALRSLGHEVVFFDTRGFILPGRIRQAMPLLARWDEARLGKAFVEANQREKPDLTLVIGGGIPPEAVRGVTEAGFLTVLWTTDPPVRPEFIRVPGAFYRRVFCSGTEAVPIIKAGGYSGEPRWLPFACDPDLHQPAQCSEEERARYGSPLVFVGSYYANRQRVFESLVPMGLKVWGPSWSRSGRTSPLATVVEDRRVNFDEWTKIYSSSDIVIVVHYQDGRTPCYQASPKLFEALACGAFVLCDDQKDARALFKDQEQVVFFTDDADLRAKAGHYLAHPGERRRIAAAGRKKVLEDHTYRRRMEELTEYLRAEGLLV